MAIEERVLCFERSLLERVGLFQGISFDVDKYLAVVTARENLTYRMRRDAEQDFRYKQLIPYVILMLGDKMLRYRRGRGGGETRLHGLYSIGIGGHISNEDVNLFSEDALGYYDGMMRELEEEVAIDAPVKEAAVAVINDDSVEVGRVHFGVVHIMHVSNENVVGQRSGIVAPAFVPITAAVRDASNYESWSQLCLANIKELLEKAAAVSVEYRPHCLRSSASNTPRRTATTTPEPKSTTLHQNLG